MWGKLSADFWMSLGACVASLICSCFIMRRDWKRYGLLFLLVALTANIICYVLAHLGFYSFPFHLFASVSKIPFLEVGTFFPLYILVGFVYSPRSWPWKIPFYWALINVGVLAETIFHMKTDLIRYERSWDLWDSYTAWWLFAFLFEWVGAQIVPDTLRSPISIATLRYGRLGWLAIHFVLVLTIFLAGVYVGTNMVK